MEPIIFRYRCCELTFKDIEFIRSKISKHYSRGRAYISKVLCSEWNWVQPNGKLKEYAARDLLLRLEEGGFIELPPLLRPSNNLRSRSFRQIPLYKSEHLVGSINNYSDLTIQLIDKGDAYLWSYLLYHYLGVPRLVGEHLRYVACIDGQVAACLAWASVAWRVRSRDEFIQ